MAKVDDTIVHLFLLVEIHGWSWVCYVTLGCISECFPVSVLDNDSCDYRCRGVKSIKRDDSLGEMRTEVYADDSAFYNVVAVSEPERSECQFHCKSERSVVENLICVVAEWIYDFISIQKGSSSGSESRSHSIEVCTISMVYMERSLVMEYSSRIFSEFLSDLLFYCLLLRIQCSLIHLRNNRQIGILLREYVISRRIIFLESIYSEAYKVVFPTDIVNSFRIMVSTHFSNIFSRFSFTECEYL